MSKLILLYSNFCNVTKKLKDDYKINWEGIFRLINIDSKNIRDAIVKSKRLKIKATPCLLIIHDGQLFKVEGNDVRTWIVKNIIQETKPIENPIEKSIENKENKEE